MTSSSGGLGGVQDIERNWARVQVTCSLACSRNVSQFMDLSVTITEHSYTKRCWFLLSAVQDRKKGNTGSLVQRWAGTPPLATLLPFTWKTWKMIFTADQYEFHTSWMTSCKDSSTSFIQQALTLWLWLFILMKPRRRQGTNQGMLLIKISCVNGLSPHPHPLYVISAMTFGQWLICATCEK